MADRLARGCALLGGLFFGVFGLWALVDPASFYEAVALWPPFNPHFIHDIGAFQIGLGLALFLALVDGDALFVALAATGAGQTLHALAHVSDRDLGGKSTDPFVMAFFAALLLVGAAARRRARRSIDPR